MTNWGDIATHQMASEHENRVREARYLANADHYLTDKPKRSLVHVIRTLRQTMSSRRIAAEPALSLEPVQKPC